VQGDAVNTALKYLTVLAALAGGCWALYKGESKIGAGLIGFAGLLTDYAEIGDFALKSVRAWRGQP